MLRPVHPASRYCRFVFHLHNAPPGGVLISGPAGRATPWLEQMLEKGFDLASVGPLVGAGPVRQLMDLITKRAKYLLYGIVHGHIELNFVLHTHYRRRFTVNVNWFATDIVFWYVRSEVRVCPITQVELAG